MKKQILFMILVAQLQAFGTAIANLDEDKTGADDMIGRIVLPSGARVLDLSAKGKLKEADAVIDSVIDGLCEYRGREIPPPVTA